MKTALKLCALTLALATSLVAAQGSDGLRADQLTPQQRGAMTRGFILKWGGYAEKVYGVPVGIWAKRMVPTFTHADALNFRKSLSRETFEGALAALNGQGGRISDTQVLDVLARSGSRSKASAPAAIRTKLGQVDADLVYTPIQPCRIVDTRLTGAGPIAANTTRDFRATATADFSSQGGSATDCGTMSINASAVALNVTAVFPDLAGYATVFPFGSTQPLASSVNYTAGAIVNNGIISKIPNPLAASDFTIYSYAGADYVVDIVGYFAAPVATALECTAVSTNTQVAAGNNFTLNAPSCSSGFALTGVGCRSNGFREVEWSGTGLTVGGGSGDGQCRGTNISANQAVITATSQCCRVPGR